MFRDHEGFQLTVLPQRATRGYRRQRIGLARRRPVYVKLDTVHNTEAIRWLQIRR